MSPRLVFAILCGFLLISLAVTADQDMQDDVEDELENVMDFEDEIPEPPAAEEEEDQGQKEQPPLITRVNIPHYIQLV